jgi:hypothetical protein
MPDIVVMHLFSYLNYRDRKALRDAICTGCVEGCPLWCLCIDRELYIMTQWTSRIQVAMQRQYEAIHYPLERWMGGVKKLREQQEEGYLSGLPYEPYQYLPL